MKVQVAEKKIWVPKITDERLMELFGRIKPLCRFDGEVHRINTVDGQPESPEYLRRIDYIRYPVAAEKATGLVKLADIRTNHLMGSKKKFQASVDEVLAQIPEEYLDQVTAFEIIGMPEDGECLDNETEAQNAGYHVVVTRLYRMS